MKVGKQNTSKKISELKPAVYQLAKVITTQQLKAQYKAIKPLDLRYKASWEKALAHLQANMPSDLSVAQKQPPSSFDDWVNSASNEFKELFADADAALGSFDEKLSKTKKLTRTAIAMADSLDEFAEASLNEAHHLAERTQRDQARSKEAELN